MSSPQTQQVFQWLEISVLYKKRDTDVQNRLLDSVGEGKSEMFWENSIETSILSRVKQISSPGWMHETSAQGWCTGMTQRVGMGREAGGGIRMGNTGKSMADSCQCMAKTTTVLKKKKFLFCKPVNQINVLFWKWILINFIFLTGNDRQHEQWRTTADI